MRNRPLRSGKGLLKMDHLSNELLITTYKRALKLELDADFVEILVNELYRRGYTKDEVKLMRNEQSDVKGLIMEQSKDFDLMSNQSEIIQLISSGTPLVDILSFIVKSMEKHDKSIEGYGLVMLYDQEINKLWHPVGPSLPKDYLSSIKTVDVGPYEGSCGTAAFFKRPIIVKNIEKDPLWEKDREGVLKYGFKSCLSIPIFSSKKELIGTIALYYKDYFELDEELVYKLESFNHLAGIAIEMAEINESLELSEMTIVKEEYVEKSEENEKDTEIAKQLIQALKRGEFELYFQPYFDLNHERRGVEALIRWNHPNSGLLLPKDFLSIAERTGFILELEKWVLKEAVYTIKRFEKEGFDDLFISVNISAHQFANKDFPKFLFRLFKENKFNPEKLKLEITERFLINEEHINVLYRLKELGLLISIDDFGTSYSSLHYLKDLPIDELKIDRSFIMDMEDNINKQKIVEMIILLAKQLKLNVVAEGVETASQLKLLKEMQCDYVQGFYFSKPITIGEIREKYYKVI